MIARLLISSEPNFLKEEIQKSLASHLDNRNVNHPDVLYFEAGSKLGIAEAKKIKEHFSLKPYSAKGRGVVLEDASVMTIEAQNALLKTLEELPREALLILGAYSDASFLPTVLSRCQVIRLQVTGYRIQEHKENIEKLLNAPVAERFEFVEKLKNREEFLQALLLYFQQNLLKYPAFAVQLLQAEEWAKQNVNIRAILEYLMLVMPNQKC